MTPDELRTWNEAVEACERTISGIEFITSKTTPLEAIEAAETTKQFCLDSIRLLKKGGGQ